MLVNRSECSACGLCEYLCPVNAIYMRQDKEGFRYPYADKEKCIECGLCKKKCPVLNWHNYNYKMCYDEKVYAGYQTNKESLLKSSSGGAANTLAKAFIRGGGCVIGTAYNYDCKSVSFVLVDDEAKLDKIRESKYVETRRNELFEIIEHALLAYKKILFIGLPCDVAAVKSFVGNLAALYTCKLCCRGTTSEKILEEYVNGLENENLSKVKRISLRYKEKNKPRFPTKLSVVFENGTKYVSDFVKTDFGKAFQIFSRPSCSSCRAKQIEGLADMTLGDFQGANPKEDYYNNDGLSLVLVHNEKGEELRNMMSNFYMKELPYDEVMSYNWMAYASIPKPALRDWFAEHFLQKGLRETCSTLVQEQNRAIDELAREMKQTQERTAMWGVGDTAENLYERFDLKNWNLKYVYDSSLLKVGTNFHGMPVRPLSTMMENEKDIDTLIVMIPSESEDKLNETLKKLGWTKKIIHTGKYKFYKG